MDPFRILLVDPVDDDRELQAVVLRSAGFTVLSPTDNPFKAAVTEQPDAIVVDVTPKRAGSAEFVQMVKEDHRTSRIPVVVVSAYPASELTPTEGFVGKPNGPNELLSELARVLDLR
jgi:CheY-like chemotaxis protein